jgi:acyl-CoA thioesterase-1
MKKFIGVLCFLLFTLCFFLPFGAMAEIRILALGDSLTEGYGVEPEEAYPYLLEQLLKEEGLEVRVINGGFSGATSASAGTRLKWYFKMRPQIMLLALGANDGLRGLDIENMKQNLAKAIQMAQERQIKVVMTGMQMPINYGETYIKAYQEAFFELAREYELPMVDFLLEGVGGIPEMNLRDGIHPNPEGHQVIARNVLKTLLPIVQAESQGQG